MCVCMYVSLQKQTQFCVTLWICSLRRTNRNWERVCAQLIPYSWYVFYYYYFLDVCSRIYVSMHVYVHPMYILITGTLMWNDFQLLFNYKRDRSCCTAFLCVCIWHKYSLLKQILRKKTKKIIIQIRVKNCYYGDYIDETSLRMVRVRKFQFWKQKEINIIVLFPWQILDKRKIKETQVILY